MLLLTSHQDVYLKSASISHQRSAVKITQLPHWHHHRSRKNTNSSALLGVWCGHAYTGSCDGLWLARPHIHTHTLTLLNHQCRMSHLWCAVEGEHCSAHKKITSRTPQRRHALFHGHIQQHVLLIETPTISPQGPLSQGGRGEGFRLVLHTGETLCSSNLSSGQFVDSSILHALVPPEGAPAAPGRAPLRTPAPPVFSCPPGLKGTWGKSNPG